MNLSITNLSQVLINFGAVKCKNYVVVIRLQKVGHGLFFVCGSYIRPYLAHNSHIVTVSWLTENDAYSYDSIYSL